MSYIHVTEGLYTRDGNVSPEYNKIIRRRKRNGTSIMVCVCILDCNGNF